MWKDILGASKGADDEKSHQLSSQMTNLSFGEVNVLRRGAKVEVTFTVLMEPAGEGWQTAVALDASTSMRKLYGRLMVGSPSAQDVEMAKRKGQLTSRTKDGSEYWYWDNAALEDLQRRGIYKYTENIVETPARDFTAYLAGHLDADGGTTVIYWACGNGDQVEVVGDFTEEQCKQAKFSGPQNVDFGNATMLLPAVQYFVDRFKDADNGMYVFITDGALNDLDKVKTYTIQLCKDIEAGRRKPVKCVLIGLGNQIDEGQMEELDDLDSGTSIDIWDHKIAKDMRSMKDIFAELVSENQIVTAEARILDSQGRVVKQFTDGMPAKVSFAMPVDSTFFTLEIGDQKIKQVIEC